MADADAALKGEVERYYSSRVREFGETARGVDWNSPESQALRFTQLARLWDGADGEISVIDYGCGYGALADFLKAFGARVRYQGYDISEAMIERASSRVSATTTFTTQADALTQADYVVASGVFNVKLADRKSVV